MRRLTAGLSILATIALAACGDDSTPGGGAALDAGADAVNDVGLSDASPADAGVQDVAADAISDAADDTADAANDGTADAGPSLLEGVCDGTTAHRWSPFESDDVEFFPDGVLMRADEQSPTGWRLDYSAELAPWLADTPPLLQQGLQALNRMSGFGTLGGTLLRFSAAVGDDLPGTAAESLTSEAWRWYDLSGDSPKRVPFEATVLEDGITVVLWPLVPLRRDAEHAVVVTTAAAARDGDCIAPSDATRHLLAGGTGVDAYERAAPRYLDALERIDLDPTAVSAVSVYRTHDDVGPMLRAAQQMLETQPEWGAWDGCRERGSLLECETSTTVLDARNEFGLVDDEVVPVEAEIPVTLWMPTEGTGPWPVLIYGHGLNSERDEGWEIARRVSDEGVIVVAMEAVEHGEHPSVDPSDPSEPALRFLGVDLEGLAIDAEAIRGNFNQTNLDRLRLVRLLRTRPDIDGDGVDDVDTSLLGYVGASLGALCGAGLLATSADIDAAVLTIGGARLLSIVTDSELLADFQGIIELLVGSQEAFDRLAPVAQHVVDPADPGLWAAHLLHDRFDDRVPPHLLVAVGMEDDVVPPASGRALARALRIDHMPPIAEPLELVAQLDEAPVSGNVADGQRTAVFFQYDRVTRNGGEPGPARHTASAKSDQSAEQIRTFFTTLRDDGLPVVVDPYEVLGTPALPAD